MSKKHLSEGTRRALREALAADRAALIGNLAQGHTSERVNAVDNDCGALSPDQHQAAKARLEAARQVLGVELARIEEALSRMRSGNYGHCVFCGQLVEHRRLQNDPAANECIACAELIAAGIKK